MTPTDLRNSFVAHAGLSQYRKFAISNGFGVHESYEEWLQELRFWEEQLWSEFSQLQKRNHWDLQLIYSAFSNCHIHNAKLTANLSFYDPLQIRDSDSTFEETRDHSFPFGILCPMTCSSCLLKCRDWLQSQPWTRPIDEFKKVRSKYRRLVAEGLVKLSEVCNANLLAVLLPLCDDDMIAVFETFEKEELEAFDGFLAEEVRSHEYQPDLIWISDKCADDEKADIRQRLLPRYKRLNALVTSKLKS